MEMSFQQYIDNPMGKHNAVFSQRDMYKKFYTEKFDRLFLREAGKIDFALYIDKKKDKYIAHIKIPSETLKNFYYDAVILFYTNDAANHASSTLQNYYVKFFSNDPAFVFTYLHVFLENDLFIEELKSKSSKLALKQDPNIKNPFKIPGYSKILYFAYLFMKTKNLFNKSVYTSYAQPYSAKKLINSVEHADIKISERQRLGKEQAKLESNAKRNEKKQIANSRTEVDSTSNNISTVKTVNTTSNTKTVKRTPFISRLNFLKGIKKK